MRVALGPSGRRIFGGHRFAVDVGAFDGKAVGVRGRCAGAFGDGNRDDFNRCDEGGGVLGQSIGDRFGGKLYGFFGMSKVHGRRGVEQAQMGSDGPWPRILGWRLWRGEFDGGVLRAKGSGADPVGVHFEGDRSGIFAFGYLVGPMRFEFIERRRAIDFFAGDIESVGSDVGDGLDPIDGVFGEYLHANAILGELGASAVEGGSERFRDEHDFDGVAD